MRNFQDTFETCKQSFISVFSVCMTIPLSILFIFQETPLHSCFRILELTVKTSKRRQLKSFWCFYCWFWVYFAPCFGVYVVGFKQIKAGCVNNVFVDYKQVFRAFLFNIRNCSPEVSNIQRSEAELNIILPRVNNFDIKQKSAWNISFIIYSQHQTKSPVNANKAK